MASVLSFGIGLSGKGSHTEPRPLNGWRADSESWISFDQLIGSHFIESQFA